MAIQSAAGRTGWEARGLLACRGHLKSKMVASQGERGCCKDPGSGWPALMTSGPPGGGPPSSPQVPVDLWASGRDGLIFGCSVFFR